MSHEQYELQEIITNLEKQYNTPKRQYPWYVFKLYQTYMNVCESLRKIQMRYKRITYWLHSVHSKYTFQMDRHMTK